MSASLLLKHAAMKRSRCENWHGSSRHDARYRLKIRLNISAKEQGFCYNAHHKLERNSKTGKPQTIEEDRLDVDTLIGRVSQYRKQTKCTKTIG